MLMKAIFAMRAIGCYTRVKTCYTLSPIRKSMNLYRITTGETVPDSRSGFTLLELMMVVAVIAIVAAVAVPNVLKSRMAANEASAITSLRQIITMNERYRLRYSEYASSFSDLVNSGLIEDGLADNTKAGYSFTYNSEAVYFTCNADPLLPGETGTRYFFIDSSGVIRFSTTGTATSADMPVDGSAEN